MTVKMIKTVTMFTDDQEDTQYEVTLRDLNVFAGVAAHIFDSDFDGVKIQAKSGQIVAKQEVTR